ncbi:MAG TPA: glycerophosphodiester phosphodiesterase [Marmoricola sp.]|nr:glycerophosphodiester phosphodiesterase [Marmoricola sp.]
MTRVPDQTPLTGFPFLDEAAPPSGVVVAMAHRGGARHPDLLGIENTMTAFAHAVALGYQYLETDTHVSADGTLFAFHDDTLDRVTGVPGRFRDLSSSDLREVRVAGRFGIPTLSELFEEFPEIRFNIDLKADGTENHLAEFLHHRNAYQRVCVGSFSHKRLQRFRKLTGGLVATSASPTEVVAFLGFTSLGKAFPPRFRYFQSLQVPVKQGPIPVVTQQFVRRAHENGVHVHVWTVDDRAEIEHLLGLGVDGLITDRTDVLKNVLTDKGLWKGTP